jgi:hypothetical protein
VHSRPAAPGLGAPWRIEELYKAVLSEQGKPWGEMRREVRQRIIDVEQAVREATELHLNDSDNELAVQRFRGTNFVSTCAWRASARVRSS